MVQKTLILTVLLVVLQISVACSPRKFSSGDSSSQITDNSSEGLGSTTFKTAASAASFTQDILSQNDTKVTFSVLQSDGFYANNLQKIDFDFSENGSTISKGTFNSNSQKIDQIVDIVFVLDITGSMKPTIESAKTRIVNFVNLTRAQGVHTRFCLVTFGDHTVNKCDKFADNDPSNPSSATQVQEFISTVSSLNVPTGYGQDYGGTDSDENQMRGLIDASKAPWLTGSQRFAILVTDAGFHYSPGNQGDSGSDAPTYDEALAAIASSQMTVFAAAPHLPGYDQNFSKNKLSIVQASQGLYFNYDDLWSGKITMDTILSKVVQRVKTTYTFDFISEENLQLNPALPLAQRQIKVALHISGNDVIEIQSIQSNLPNGRAQYKTRWTLSDKKIKVDSVQVTVNGQIQKTGFHLENGDVVFDQAPASGAKIDVQYQYTAIKDNLRIQPLVLSGVTDLKLLVVYFNDQVAYAADYVLTKDQAGNYSLRPSDSALADDDRYHIVAKGELKIRVEKKRN